jgi:hypothetical protein
VEVVMIKPILFVSLDALLDRQAAREREWDEAGDGQYVAGLLEGIPDEEDDTRDLVAIFAA